MQNDVFISYKSEEIAYTEKVAKYLEQKGLDVWYAPRNLTHNAGGELYDDVLANVIKRVRVVVVIVSEMSLNSFWVRAEVQRAEKTNKPIIPLVISEYTADNGLVMRLEMLHMIKAYPNFDSQLPVLLENVHRHLGKKPSGDVTMPIMLDFSNNRKEFCGYDYSFEEGMALYNSGEKLESVEFFLRSAQRGNKEARSILCELFYEQNRDFNRIDDDLWNTIESVSDQGEAFADFLMHCKYYAMGNQNVIAMRYLQKSLEREVIPLALLRMGICYNWGLGVKQNHILGIYYYEKAKTAGCKQVYSYLAQEYLWGSDKIKKSLEKAEQYILEGIENGDTRCYSQLQNLYSDQFDKIRETAQKMIDEGIEGACTMMAEYYGWNAAQEDRDNEKAIEWAFKALEANEKGAYGLISALYYGEDNEESLKYARIGAEQGGDSRALYILGWDSEMENDYAAAWNQYLVRFEKYGTGSEDLGRLFFGCGYSPEGMNLGDLKQILMVGARNHNIDSLNYLLQMLIYERSGKNSAIDYYSLKDIAEAYEYIELGADMGNANLRFIQGRIMMEVAGCHYNPRKGREIIETIANSDDNGYVGDAVCFMLTHSEKDADKWLRIALEHNVNLVSMAESDNTLPRLTEFVKDSKIDDKALWKSYLYRCTEIMDFDGEQRIEVWFALVDKVLELCGKDNDSVEEWLIQKVRDRVEDCIDSPNLLYNIHRHFDAVFQDYNTAKLVELGKTCFDEKIWKLFCIACSDSNKWKYRTSEHLEALSKPLTDNVELMTTIGECDDFELTGTKLLKNYMDEFSDVYFKVCDEYSHTAKVKPVDLNYRSTVPYTKPELLEYIIENRVECLLEILPLIEESTRKELVNNIYSHSKILLDVVEKIDYSTNLQLLLITYVENIIEVNGLFEEQAKLVDGFLKGDDEGKQAIEKYFAVYCDPMKISHCKFDQDKTDDEWEKTEDEKQEKDLDSKEFDKLLDDFINTQLNDE